MIAIAAVARHYKHKREEKKSSKLPTEQMSNGNTFGDNGRYAAQIGSQTGLEGVNGGSYGVGKDGRVDGKGW